MSLCVLCRGKKPNEADIGYVCYRCFNRVLRQLSDIEEYAAVLTSEKGTGSGGRRAPGFGPGSPARDDVIVALDYRSSGGAAVHRLRDPRDASDTPIRSLLGSLHGIASDIREQREMATPKEPPTITSELRCIRLNLQWVAEQHRADDDGEQHPVIPDVADDISELHSQARALSPFAEPRKYIGNCRSPKGDSEECAARLYATLDAESVECPSCGDEWPRERWLWLGRVLDAG